MKSLFGGNRTALDIVDLIAGLGLLLSPWYLGYAGQTVAAWTAWITGVAVVVTAAAALFASHRVAEWINLVLGAWAVIAPWALGFAVLAAAAWIHVIAGLIIAAVAAGSMWFTHNRPLSTA